MQLRKVHTNS